MSLLILSLPLTSYCSLGLIGKKLGPTGSSFITSGSLGITCIASFLMLIEVVFLHCPVYLKLITWVDLGSLNFNWGFLFDSLTVTMCCIVSIISFFVHCYSTEYMSHDPHLPRFMSYLSLFTFFMLILVTSDNFVQMFLGWEGVGLCSYLLINFWFTRIQANKAAIKAMVINKIGDFGILVSILILFINYKTLDYAVIFALTPVLKEKTVVCLTMTFSLQTTIGTFLIIGVIGKSAQLGLHTWLPDAMEGPTPVSALIHAATMVTAGVFLMARCSSIYEFSGLISDYIIIIGSLTSLFASTVGLFQNDLKKVIAYSTCSQLGYMVFICGLTHQSLGIYHLSNHAFFKALLFLCAGSVIHSALDEQDMRKLGGLKKLLPISYSSIVIGSLALIGFPFLTGFYSKDLILEIAYSKHTHLSYLAYVCGIISAFFTACYSVRLVALTFLTKPNGYKLVVENATNLFYQINIVLILLSVFSILIGFLCKDALIGWGSYFWNNAIYNFTYNQTIVDSEFDKIKYKLLPTFCSFFGLFVTSFFIFFRREIIFKVKLTKGGRKIYNFLNRKWFFDKLFNELISQKGFKFGLSVSYKLIDRGIFEILGPTGLCYSLNSTSDILFKFHTRYVYHYIFTTLTGMCLLLNIRKIWVMVGFIADYRLIGLLIVTSIFLAVNFDDNLG